MLKTFNDYLLTPQFSDIDSRDEIDLSSKLGDRTLSLPVISSPMTTVTEDEMALAMNQKGGYGVIHRYNTIDERILLSSRSRSSCVAIGCNEINDLDRFVEMGITDFCLDVAHGHTRVVGDALREIRRRYGYGKVYVIAGNVATKDGYEFLVDAGANASENINT
jgi:IMP dehydrogenase/GMP reductase